MKIFAIFIFSVCAFTLICSDLLFSQEEDEDIDVAKKKAETEKAIKVMKKLKADLDNLKQGYNLEFMMQSQAENSKTVVTLEGTGAERPSQYQQKTGYYVINKITIGETEMKPKKKGEIFAEIYQNNYNFAIMVNLHLNFRDKMFLEAKESPPKKWIDLYGPKKEADFNYRAIFITPERIFDLINRSIDSAKIMNDVDKIKVKGKDIRTRKLVIKLNDNISSDIKSKLEIPEKATTLAEEVVASDYKAEIIYEELSSSDNLEKSATGKIIRLDFAFIQHVDYKIFKQEKGLVKETTTKKDEEEFDPWKQKPRKSDDTDAGGDLMGSNPGVRREEVENPQMEIQAISLDGYFQFSDYNEGKQFTLPQDDEARKILRY